MFKQRKCDLWGGRYEWNAKTLKNECLDERVLLEEKRELSVVQQTFCRCKSLHHQSKLFKLFRKLRLWSELYVLLLLIWPPKRKLLLLCSTVLVCILKQLQRRLLWHEQS